MKASRPFFLFAVYWMGSCYLLGKSETRWSYRVECGPAYILGQFSKWMGAKSQSPKRSSTSVSSGSASPTRYLGSLIDRLAIVHLASYLLVLYWSSPSASHLPSSLPPAWALTCLLQGMHFSTHHSTRLDELYEVIWSEIWQGGVEMCRWYKKRETGCNAWIETFRHMKDRVPNLQNCMRRRGWTEDLILTWV